MTNKSGNRQGKPTLGNPGGPQVGYKASGTTSGPISPATPMTPANAVESPVVTPVQVESATAFGSVNNDPKPVLTKGEPIQQNDPKPITNRRETVEPNGLIIRDGEPVKIHGEEVGRYIIVREDTYQERYPYGSRRPSFFLLYRAGEKLPLSQVQVLK